MSTPIAWLLLLAAWGLALCIGCALDEWIARRRRARWPS